MSYMFLDSCRAGPRCSCQNKFVKLVHLVGFIIKKYSVKFINRAESVLISWQVFQLVKKSPAFYGTPRVHYSSQKCQPPVPILSQLNPVHTPIFHFLQILSSSPAKIILAVTLAMINEISLQVLFRLFG